MIYRLVVSGLLILILALVGAYLDGGSSPSTSPAPSTSSAGPDDSAMKSLKIE